MKLLLYSFKVSAFIALIVFLLVHTDRSVPEAAAQNSESITSDSIQVLSINLLFSEIDDRNKRLKRIADYVAENNVDVVLLQEVVRGDLVNTDNSALDLRDYIFDRHQLIYNTATETDKILSNLLRVGNGILSRHEIEAAYAKELPNASELEIFGVFELEIERNVMMLRLNVSGFGAIHIYNTHLCASCEIAEREGQLNALLQFVDDIESNISGVNPVVVGGDFNIDRFKKNGLEKFLYEKLLLEGFGDAYAAAAVDTLDNLCDDEAFPDEHCTIGVSDLGDSNPGRIDYIFTKGFGGVIESRVIFNTAISGDPTVSDHSAVFVSLDLTSLKTNPPINFNDFSLDSYGGTQDKTGDVSIENGGTTLRLVGNRWQQVEFNYTITPDTVLEFDFQSGAQGEIHGIGFDTDLNISSDRIFKLYGTQSWGIQDFNNYSGGGVIRRYRIPVGNYYIGFAPYLFFTMDHDVTDPTGESVFSNIKVYEDTF